MSTTKEAWDAWEEQRRTDHLEFMEKMQAQNELLFDQNIALNKIVVFITPISVFFDALRTVAKFAAFLIGLGAACVGIWEAMKIYVKTH